MPPPSYLVNNHHVPPIVSGILEKWVNCGKGWKPRWFVLQDGVLSYYKIQGLDVSKQTDKGCRVIGTCFPHHAKPLGEIHLKVSSIRESRSDDRRFSIYTGTQRLHLRANNHEDQIEWIESFKAMKRLFPRMSNKELLNSKSSEIPISTDVLRARLLKEGVKEETIQDSEGIMRTEFADMQTQVARFRKKLRLLIDTL